eukprot:CAMPEP_0197259482 /NCGR_PEP_ID=MMETSP1429-20130617/83538_1 /TAXON_ID=49237 /ORGANISM="Chaetoceros  sp., Strain UNC1202" /LENGTH=158 /DNA_ID=CAMNT_0042723689 /DNA_START=703 /DNA_END=1179 /DNA_ORIENTATION=-
MTVKRRNHGRNKKGRGHVKRVRCVSTGKAIPKDKAIKRFIVRNIVDASSLRDIRDNSAIENYQLPKLYLKMYYCVEAKLGELVIFNGGVIPDITKRGGIDDVTYDETLDSLILGDGLSSGNAPVVCREIGSVIGERRVCMCANVIILQEQVHFAPGNV